MPRYIPALLLIATLVAVCGCKKKSGSLPDFTYTGTPRVGYDLAFHSNVTNATKYQWDFGDGSTSIDSAPHHVFSSLSSFIVTLVLNNDNTRKITKTITIAPAIDFTITGTPTAGYSLAFLSNAPTSSNYLWTFSDGSTSSLAAPTHIYAANGTYLVSLQVDNDASHIIQKTLTLFSNGVYLSLIPLGTVSWRHEFSPSHGAVQILADTAMTINFISPASISIGNDTLDYIMTTNSDSTLIFNHNPSDSAGYSLIYDLYFNRYTHAMTYDKKHFMGSIGTTDDLYYNP